MTVHTRRVVDDEGRLQVQVWSDSPDAHIVVTGPITGPVTLADGRVVDVTDDFVEMGSQADALALSDAIGAKHAEQGHPDFLADPEVPNDGFAFVPSSESHPDIVTPEA